MVKFPKFTRKEDDRCKLSDQDIKEIKERHKQGESYASLGRIFGVTPPAIYYWCKTNKQRRETSKKNYERNVLNGTTFNDKEYQKTYRKKRLKLHPETREYEKEMSCSYKKENPEKQKAYGKTYHAKNREKRNAQSSAYYKKKRQNNQ